VSPLRREISPESQNFAVGSAIACVTSPALTRRMRSIIAPVQQAQTFVTLAKDNEAVQREMAMPRRPAAHCWHITNAV